MATSRCQTKTPAVTRVFLRAIERRRERAILFPPLRSFAVALLESRPEGAATCQPRAPPWELDRVLRIATPRRGRTGLWSRILFRPFRAGRILIRIGSPGRCPGLSCFGPFGAAEKRDFKTAYDSNVSGFFRDFLSSDARRRSTFLTSSAAGSFSGR